MTLNHAAPPADRTLPKYSLLCRGDIDIPELYDLYQFISFSLPVSYRGEAKSATITTVAMEALINCTTVKLIKLSTSDLMECFYQQVNGTNSKSWAFTGILVDYKHCDQES